MRVEALAGRSREALEVYGRLEATLHEELDVEPSAETQRLV
jgi:DNA-binding SARP family transcriptional activator